MSVYVKSSSLHEGSVRNVVDHAEDYLVALFPASGIEWVRASGEFLKEESRGILPVDLAFDGQIQYVMVSAGQGRSEGQIIRAGVMVSRSSVDAVFRPLMEIKYFGSVSECSKLARVLQEELEGIYLFQEQSSLGLMYKKMLDKWRQPSVRGYVRLSLSDEGMVRVCECASGRILDECKFEQRADALAYLADWALLVGRHVGMEAVSDAQLIKEIMDQGCTWSTRYLGQAVVVADEAQVERVSYVNAVVNPLGSVDIVAVNLKGKCVAIWHASMGNGSLQEQMNEALLYDGVVVPQGQWPGLRGDAADDRFEQDGGYGQVRIAGLSEKGFWFEPEKMPSVGKYLLEGCVEVDVTHPAERQR